jgi:hypothetical protein
VKYLPQPVSKDATVVLLLQYVKRSEIGTTEPHDSVCDSRPLDVGAGRTTVTRADTFCRRSCTQSSCTVLLRGNPVLARVQFAASPRSFPSADAGGAQFRQCVIPVGSSFL